MGIEVKVEVIHKETIKSSPTPPHLQTTKLSVFDQLFPDIYVPLLLFYPKKGSAAEVNINTDLWQSKDPRSSKDHCLKPSSIPLQELSTIMIQLIAMTMGQPFLEPKSTVPYQSFWKKQILEC